MRTVFETSDPAVNVYALVTSLVVPRPIAWVGTVSADGVGNLAPHSFYTVACGEPPVVLFSSTGLKDTVRNVQETGEFVINVAHESLTDLVNDSAAPFDPHVDETDHLGIAMEPSAVVSVPRVVGSPASIECRLHSQLVVGTATLVLGDVVAITVSDDVLVDGRHPDIGKLRPMSRLGRNQWGVPPVPIPVNRPLKASDVPRRPRPATTVPTPTQEIE